MTITEFLLARIAEDETCPHCKHPVAQHIGRWCRTTTGAVTKAGTERICCCEGADAGSRLLAECEAKRRIVERETSRRIMHWHVPWDKVVYSGGRTELHGAAGAVLAKGEDAQLLVEQHSDPITDTPVLRYLAAVYADHSEYREEWRP